MAISVGVKVAIAVAVALSVSIALGVGLGVGLTRNDSSGEDNTVFVDGDPDEEPLPDPIEVNCEGETSPIELNSRGVYDIPRASAGGNLCMIVAIAESSQTSEEFLIPLGRSYDGYDWETVPPLFLEFDCDEDLCRVYLPRARSEERFYLHHFTHTLSTSEEQVSRFLTQATFGATTESIESYIVAESTPSTFLKDQMEASISTELRRTFRSRSFGRMATPSSIGIARHPCHVGSRWRNFAFSQSDSYLPITFHETEGEGVVVRVDGFARTEYSTAPTRQRWDSELGLIVTGFNEGDVYHLTYWTVDNEVGGRVVLFSETDENWWTLISGNPVVQFMNDVEALNITVLPLTEAEENNFVEINNGKGLTLTTEDLDNDELCLSIPALYPLLETILIEIDSEWYLHDPGLALQENTLESPIPDGGGAIAQLDPDTLPCSNAPRTFLNEESCLLSPEPTACAVDEILVDEETEDPLLDEETLSNIFRLTGRYVYIVEGLRVDTSYGATRNPCSSGVVSRWLKIDAPCVEGTFPDVPTKDALQALLLAAQGDNEILIDIVGPGCTVDPVLYEIIIEIDDGVCYQNVHRDLMNVYDMSYWALPDTHNGNKGKVPNPITNFAEPIEPEDEPTFILTFPGHHEMERWEINHVLFTYVGRAGDRIGYGDLPAILQTIHVADYFGTLGSSTGGSNTLVCGSPGEVTNDPSQNDLGEFATSGTSDEYLRSGFFHHAVLERDDQLRQRVAWALSQLLSISPFDITGSESEIFLNYYDIFIRNAFGNYFDILKEVSYSPMMGEMLSFLGSRSTQDTFQRYGVVVFPDENFAREIMQLFTIGLVQLNPDGTVVVDEESGAPIENYDNEDIITGARLWTAFERQSLRGNIEPAAFWLNRIDPMRVTARYRDRFPKMNLYDGYIGDGYPLCAELPLRSFLRKGARFRLLGSSSRPELQYEDSSWATNDDVTRFTLDEESDLYGLLCAAGSEGCTFPALVTLEDNLDCYGDECKIETMTVIKLGSFSIYYEYVQQPCVDLAFINNAKKVQHIWGRYICGDPRKPMALASCCRSHEVHETLIWWDSTTYCEYVGERMSFGEAEDRCVAHDEFSCETSSMRHFDSDEDNFCAIGRSWYWTTDTCDTKAKINLKTGKIAVTHDASGASYYDELDPYEHVRPDVSVTWFRVAWEDDLPSKCESPCEELEFDGSCFCPTSVVDSPVFTEEPSDLSKVSSQNLHVGCVSPDTFDVGDYSSHSWTDGDRTVNYWIPSDGSLSDMRTIFEVTEKGLTKYYRNMVSRVEVEIGSDTYRFRNAPHFNSLQDLNNRDAMYETDAYLEHLVYHDNTAPFLAIRLMQRFGFSNPSPRFVAAVSQAFTDGKYVSTDEGVEFGTGRLGDLGATVAAILLDREARSAVLDADPIYGSLKEPLLRVLQFMRAMKLELATYFPLLKMTLFNSIGEEAFKLPSVFSFFLPEYSPPGVISAAGLVSPEAYVLNTPKSLGLVSGLLSLVKYGLTNCESEWVGRIRSSCNLAEGDYSDSAARITFTPTVSTSEGIVDELALLFTPGRLSPENRQTMIDILDALEEDTSDLDAPLRLAQQLMVTTPEFHTLNFIRRTGEARTPPPPPAAPSKSYKAIVFFFLAGGADTYNLLVPYGDCDEKDMFAHYSETRGVIALKKSDLQAIDASGSDQVCDTFGLHPSVPFLKELYEDGDLSFLANTGVLHKVSDKTNYRENHRTQLFAHNVMSKETFIVDPFQEVAGTGVLGRMVSRLQNLEDDSYSAQSISLGDQGDALVGEPGISPSVTFLTTRGLNSFDPRPSHENMPDFIETLNAETEKTSSLFGETWSSTFLSAISENEVMKAALEASTLATDETWNRDYDIERQMEVVARMIDVAELRGTERDVFFVRIGGWDTHADVADTLLDRFNRVNEAIEGFVNEMKAQGKHDEVLTVLSSEFARTLTPNSGQGSDHAWGGNYALIGGDVDGGKIHGTFPDDLSDDGPLGLGRGRLVPTTSWEQVWNGVAEWFGLSEDEDLDYVLLNRKEFEDHLFTKDDLFE